MANEINDVWEAVQMANGDTFIYRGGFKAEASVNDVVKFGVSMNTNGQITCQFSRFDFNPAAPCKGGTIQTNPAQVLLRWLVDPSSSVISQLRSAMREMDAKQSGLVLPNSRIS